MFNLNKNNMPYKNYEQQSDNMPGLNLVRPYTPKELARKKELEEQWEKEEKIFDELFEQYLIKNNLSKDEDDEYVLIAKFLIDEEKNLSKLGLQINL